MKVFYRLNGVNSFDSTGYLLKGTTPANLATYSYSGLNVIKDSLTTLEVGAVYSSGSKGVRLGRISAVITYTLPVAPSGLTATPISTSSVELSWTDNAIVETGYRVERSLDGISEWVQISGDLAVNTTLFTDDTVTSGITYYYRVYAFNSAGNLGYSNISEVNTNIPVAPSVVTLNTLSCGGTPTDMNLSWTDNSFNETGFDLEQSVDGINYTFLATVGADVVSHDFVGSECNYRIRAYNDFGHSTWSTVDIIQ
jgi:hypothetical protein